MFKTKYSWPLQNDPFGILDKLRASKLIVSGARLTQGVLVKKYEEIWENFIGSKSVAVSSGSTANILIAMWWKYCLQKSGEWESRKEVLVPIVTWPTSINQLIMLGFKPVFFDVSLENYGLNYQSVVDYLSQKHKNVAGIFPTTLIGLNPDMRFIELSEYYNIKIAFDNCEASFNHIEKRSQIYDKYGISNIYKWKKYISSIATSSTSTYIGHYTSSIEGGIIHCRDEEEFRFYLMARNHGMVRSLIPYADRLTSYNGMNGPDDICWEYLYNSDVDPQFDFNVIGNNFRMTDLNAKFGILDSKKWERYIKHRNKIGEIWKTYFRGKLPQEFGEEGNVPFSLPITAKNKETIVKIKNLLKDQKIEFRSLVAGSLHRQSCYKDIIAGQDFKHGDFIHENCMYIGIPNNLDENLVYNTIKKINYFI